MAALLTGNRWFESTSLQRRIPIECFPDQGEGAEPPPHPASSVDQGAAAVSPPRCRHPEEDSDDQLNNL